MKSFSCITFFAAFIIDHVTYTLAYSLRGSESQSIPQRDDRFSAVGNFLKNHKSEFSQNLKDIPAVTTSASALSSRPIGSSIIYIAKTGEDMDVGYPSDYYGAETDAYYDDANSYTSSEEYGSVTDDYESDDTVKTELSYHDQFTVVINGFVSNMIWLQQQPSVVPTASSDRESYYLDGGLPLPCPCQVNETVDFIDIEEFGVGTEDEDLEDANAELDGQEKEIFIRQDRPQEGQGLSLERHLH